MASSACSFEPVDPSAAYRCDETRHCPPGVACIDGVCGGGETPMSDASPGRGDAADAAPEIVEMPYACAGTPLLSEPFDSLAEWSAWSTGPASAGVSQGR